MIAKTDAWMPLWIGSYLADTQHLARNEHGGYLLLIMAYWRTGAALPDDDKRLSAIVRATPKEWKTLRPVLAEFFQVQDGVWRHKRIDQELAAASNNRAQKSAAGKASAAKRWCNGDDNGKVTDVITDVTNPLQRQSNPTPSPTPNTTSQPGAREAMRPDWHPSPHVADQAKQAMSQLTPAIQQEFIAYWLTKPETQRTQAEWDKALLKSALHAKAAGASKPAKGPQPENFDKRDYGTGVSKL